MQTKNVKSKCQFVSNLVCLVREVHAYDVDEKKKEKKSRFRELYVGVSDAIYVVVDGKRQIGIM